MTSGTPPKIIFATSNRNDGYASSIYRLTEGVLKVLIILKISYGSFSG